MKLPARRLVAVAIVGAGIVGAVLVVWILPRQQLVAELPPITASPFLNTRPGVAYVGMKRCQSCHAEAHTSYLQTAHSQALALVDLDSEPPDGEFDDPRTFRHYRIYREEGKLRHEESTRTGAGKKLVLADYPVKYVIGSGRFSRSYLVEQDGFLFESPATWYAARPGWNLSPGYENANSGFQRPVELRCLTCHAGHVDPVERSPHKVEFHAQAIDCERCHGPGELHVSRRESADRKNLAMLQQRDETIVNPAYLDRQRREDICAQCHFHGAATIELRGRNLQDFRPGQLLAEYVVHFGKQGASLRMEVVGHGEQMRASRCYQASDTLTCTTCHDPHAKPAAGEAANYYREKCLSCHAVGSCGQPIETRRKSDPADNCIACHMPRGPTEIPHFAFTHHRIGIHEADEPAPHDSEPAELIPISEGFALTAADQARNLGLAYMQFLDGPGQAEHATIYNKRTFEYLLRSDVLQLRDSQTDAALARLYLGDSPKLTLKYAHALAKSEQMLPDDWATACFTLGATYYQLDQPAEALPWLEKAVKVRPTADIWIMVSDCRAHLQALPQAADAARHAAEMAPDRPRYLQRYAELLEKTGQSDRAAQLQERIRDLFEYRRRIAKPAVSR